MLNKASQDSVSKGDDCKRLQGISDSIVDLVSSSTNSRSIPGVCLGNYKSEGKLIRIFVLVRNSLLGKHQAISGGWSVAGVAHRARVHDFQGKAIGAMVQVYLCKDDTGFSSLLLGADEKDKGKEGSSTPATLQEDFVAGWRRLTDSTNRGADLRYEEHPTTQSRVGVRMESGRRSHRDWTMSPPPMKAKETGEVDIQNQAPEHSIGIRLGHGRSSDRIHEALAKRLKRGGSVMPTFNPEPPHAAGMDLCTPQTTRGSRGTSSSPKLVSIFPRFRMKEKRGRSHTWLAHG
ncbi:hypothetical protein VNO77_20012 [Canavalia gladiata]|uniref:Uncharacterized protein n=1 Tax=Canavalia gladiata TaxID=3824 RepID=A0AAN9QM05_CANGL